MKRFALIVTLALAATTLVTAQGIDATILQLQQSAYSSAFSETKVLPKLKKETTKSGVLEWQSPSHLKMDYSDPAGDYTLIEDVVFSVNTHGALQKLPAKDANTKTGLLRLTLLNAFQGKVADIAAMTGDRKSVV